MRSTMIKIALAAGMTLALSACGGGSATNNTAANELDANMTMSEPANDQSAMESVTNAAEPVAPLPTDNGAGTGSDVGGDTGGNNVESNTVGM